MTPYYADDLVTLYHGDALEILPTIPAGSVKATVQQIAERMART